MNHELKILEKFYIQLKSGVKTFEIRKNDRNFQVGDIITFKILFGEDIVNYESDIKLQITNVFQEKGFGLEEGYCILSFKKIDL